MHSTAKMSDTAAASAVAVEDKQQPSSSPPPSLFTTFIDSFEILLRNRHVYFPIFLFLTLPLSVILFSLTLSSRSAKSQIYHLESLASFAHTRFEARHVWKESREEAVSLLRFKALFFIPSFMLSFLAAISAVSSTALAYHGRRSSILVSISAVRTAWKRVSVTVIVVYSLMLVYAQVPWFLAVVFSSGPLSRLLILAVGSGFEIYLMAVMGLALVVSVLEEKFGWDAVRVGWDLMEGRRLSGWLLSGSFAMLSTYIGYRLEQSGGEFVDRSSSSSPFTWTVVIENWDRGMLVCLYGVDVLWCYVVTTVFYCEGKKRQVGIRSSEEDESFNSV